MELSVVSFNSEWLDFGFECRGQSVLSPVFLFSVGTVSTISLILEMLIEGKGKVTLEDR